MDILTSYNMIIEASIIIILSFIFGEISKKTSIPSVLMLIVLGIGLKFGLDALGLGTINFFPLLEVLGIVGLIMIVLEAALELELKKEKLIPIAKALVVALLGLLGSIWAAAWILQMFIEGITTLQAWLYATPISILSSAIIIPSVTNLKPVKREFHVYESTFSDILGIMVFYFITGLGEPGDGHSGGFGGFVISLTLTFVIAIVASYAIVMIFQKIQSHVKLFLLISILLLIYAVGKKMHLSSLIIILVFGLVIANIKVFFQGKIAHWLHWERASHIYEGLHVVTGETAFVVRTFFFVIFGLTISLASLASGQVVLISGLIVLSIYLVRFIILRIFLGSDLIPQLFIAPRGLITVLLFYAIPTHLQMPGFEAGILLFIIIVTSLIMTFAMIYEKTDRGKR
ncbi:MAG: cation:proton antiporter [Saprospiraceae bacterium]|nr:cation:proton antiporter [Saprospiraceae bacterium]